jgi:hypothetical protein
VPPSHVLTFLVQYSDAPSDLPALALPSTEPPEIRGSEP